MLGGLTARSLYIEEGKRQISAVHIAGDFVDLHGMLLKVMDHSIVALSDCKSAFIPHASLLDLIDKEPHLGRLLWLSTLIDGAIQRAWITSLGRRSAAAHLGHLICELHARLAAVGLAKDGRFEFPINQTSLADMLGLSLVHANRSLQVLRATGWLQWQGSEVAIQNFKALAEFSEFDPIHLNLVKEPR